MRTHDKIIIKEVGDEPILEYRDLYRLFNTIQERSKAFIKSEQIEMCARIEDMKRGVLVISIKVSDDIIDRKDYITQIVNEGIRWFFMRHLFHIACYPSGEPPFVTVVKPIFDYTQLSYCVSLYNEYTGTTAKMEG